MQVRVLMRAMQRESVPQIRQVFNDVLAARETLTDSASSNPSGEESSLMQRQIPELARLIRHELSPPIGWIRKAGGREIAHFQRSSTSDAVNRLERRIDALIALIREGSDLDLVECGLERTLRECWPDMTAEPMFIPAPDLAGRPALIHTDLGLFEILLANAYQNAIDASLEVDEPRSIEVSWSVVGDRFWVRISNPFAGTQFDVRDVETTGISSKSGHQGIGVSLIKTAAEKLGYGFKIAGRSGVATFTLTGGRNT
ncbi:hypothetical protein ATN38_24320 [Rhodococcus sp. FH8]|nr:hypothetical protein [Rhodococcus sp. FH8]